MCLSDAKDRDCVTESDEEEDACRGARLHDGDTKRYVLAMLSSSSVGAFGDLTLVDFRFGLEDSASNQPFVVHG